MRQLVCTLTALLGAAAAALFGGWDEGITVLCILTHGHSCKFVWHCCNVV